MFKRVVYGSSRMRVCDLSTCGTSSPKILRRRRSARLDLGRSAVRPRSEATIQPRVILPLVQQKDRHPSTVALKQPNSVRTKVIMTMRESRKMLLQLKTRGNPNYHQYPDDSQQSAPKPRGQWPRSAAMEQIARQRAQRLEQSDPVRFAMQMQRTSQLRVTSLPSPRVVYFFLPQGSMAK